MRRSIPGFFLAASLFAQAPLTTPGVGLIRDKASVVRPVMGVAGSFILGDAVQNGAISAAFSSRGGIVKTDLALLAIDPEDHVLATQEVPDGAALIGFPFSSGVPARFEALIYLERNQTLLHWNGWSFDALPFDPAQLGGDVVSITMTDTGGAVFVVRREDGLWLLRTDIFTGTVNSVQALPGVSAPALALADGSLLYADSGALVLRRADASELRYPLPIAVASFEQMTDDWVHVHGRENADGSAGRDFAMRLTKGREQIYELPRLPQGSQ